MQDGEANWDDLTTCIHAYGEVNHSQFHATYDMILVMYCRHKT